MAQADPGHVQGFDGQSPPKMFEERKTTHKKHPKFRTWPNPSDGQLKKNMFHGKIQGAKTELGYAVNSSCFTSSSPMARRSPFLQFFVSCLGSTPSHLSLCFCCGELQDGMRLSFLLQNCLAPPKNYTS